MEQEYKFCEICNKRFDLGTSDSDRVCDSCDYDYFPCEDCDGLTEINVDGCKHCGTQDTEELIAYTNKKIETAMGRLNENAKPKTRQKWAEIYHTQYFDSDNRPRLKPLSLGKAQEIYKDNASKCQTCDNPNFKLRGKCNSCGEGKYRKKFREKVCKATDNELEDMITDNSINVRELAMIEIHNRNYKDNPSTLIFVCYACDAELNYYERYISGKLADVQPYFIHGCKNCD